jgi:Acetyltransferases
MPEFDDVIQAPQYRPHLDYDPADSIERYTVLLKDGETTATIYPFKHGRALPPGLLAFLCDEFNMEIDRGDTSAFFGTLRIEEFENYWFGTFAAVMVLGDSPVLEGARQWEKECLGTFLIKANYPGRCAHICTANFLVNAGIRGKGIGRTLTDCFLQWAPRLGYTYSIFNLVFETNVAARRIWESLNFKRIGRVKSAGILKGHDQAVDAIIYGRELINTSDPAVGAYRFDKIKFYLETGRYPAMADRQEKSRLRSSASHYRLESGKLMLKGREVVSDPVRQLQICSEIHLSNHGGINKTTSIVTEKYHWTRIKDTVATAIKNCAECRDPTREAPIIKRNPLPKKMAPGNRPRSSKSYDQPTNGRNMIRPRSNDEVEAMVAAAQLHNIPSNRHDSDGILGHDLAGLDDNLIAVVEEAQRSHQQQQQRLHHNQDDTNDNHHHHLHLQQHQSYAAAAASAVSGDSNQYQQYQNDYSSQHEYQNSNKHRNNGHEIPVDPEVSAFDHNSGGDEIEIARALIQANEDVEEEDESDHHHHQNSNQSNNNYKDNENNDDPNIFIKS